MSTYLNSSAIQDGSITENKLSTVLQEKLTGRLQETDPIFSTSPVASISSTDISNWNTGSALGATSVQPGDISDMATQTWVSGQGFLKTELEPAFNSSAAKNITTSNITSWDAKQDAIEDIASIRSGAALGTTALQTHQSIKTINNTALTGTGNIPLASSIYMNNVSKTPATSSNVGRVDLGNVAQSIYMNNTSYTPTTGSTNTGRVNLGTVITAVRVNGSDKSVSSGRVDLGNIYSKSEIDSTASNITSTAESLVNSEATTRSQADTNLQNTKQNNLNTLSGYSNSGNCVLVSLSGSLQWKQFNNILAGSATPMSSDGNDGDIYIQTQ